MGGLKFAPQPLVFGFVEGHFGVEQLAEPFGPRASTRETTCVPAEMLSGWCDIGSGNQRANETSGAQSLIFDWMFNHKERKERKGRVIA